CLEFMSANIEILTLNSSLNLASIEEIFFLTANIENFSSAQAREKFKHKYFGLYLERFPELVKVALAGEKILGYCLGSPYTDKSFYPYQAHLPLFDDLYQQFPAHLHINLHPDAQGLGIGQKLFHYWQVSVQAQ